MIASRIAGPPRPARAARFGARLAVAYALVLGVILTTPASESAFFGTTTGAAGWGAAASFPTYPLSVRNDGAQFQHRQDDQASLSSTSNAADSSGFNRTGTYQGSTDGPSTWYRFDEASGSTAHDSSGAVNTGTLQSSPTRSAGTSGGGLAFAGAPQFVQGAGPAVDTTASFTVSAWATLTVAYGDHKTVVSQDGANISGFFLQYKPDLHRWVFHMRDADDIGATSAQVVSLEPPSMDKWTHLVGVYDDDNDRIRLYVDGVLQGSTAKTAEAAFTGPFMVGAGRFMGYTDYHLGNIDEVRAYRRALGATEIARLYQRPTTWWDFTDLSLTQRDQSGNGNTGTMPSGMTFTSDAANFDGTSQHVAGKNAALRTDASYAVAARVFLLGTTGTQTIASQPGTLASAFELGLSGGYWQFRQTASDVGAPVTAVAQSTTAVAGAWVHLVGVYSAEDAEIRLYVNGHLEARASVTSAWHATGALNGARSLVNGSWTRFYNGRIEDLKTFDHAVTDEDVHGLYAAPVSRYDFDEAAGATVVDSSGGTNHATRYGTGTTWLPTSRRGAAMSFNGTNDHLRTTGPVLDTTQSYSVSAWVWLNSTATYSRTIVGQDGANVSQFFLQYYNWDGSNKWAFQTEGADSTDGAAEVPLVSAGTAVQQRWTHLVGVYDDAADQVRLYVNGTLSSTGTQTLDFAATGPLSIGAAKWNGVRDDYWAGYLDEVAVYQRALTTADVAQIHSASPKLIWAMGENVGNPGDKSGNNYNGTRNGATWTAGYRDYALDFDGVDDSVTAAAPVDTTDSFTVAAWVNLDTSGTARTAVSQNSASRFGYLLGYDGTRWVFRMSNSTGTVYTAQSAAPASTGQWVHLVGVYDDSADQLRLYVDGRWDGTATYNTTEWSATGSFVAGYHVSASTVTARWDGRIDEVTTYGRKLGAAEVQAAASAAAPAPLPWRVRLPGATAGIPGALQGAQQGQQASTAVAFNGTAWQGNGRYQGPGHAVNPIQYANPSTFSIEAWFRTTGYGTIAAFGSTETDVSPTQRDRILYVDSGGRLAFGVIPSGVRHTLNPTTVVNDGAWHHVVATLGPAGMRVYVDGVRVGENAAVTAAENITGYWRWGGAGLSGWPNRPTNDYFTGTIDEFAVYPGQLTDQQVARHYAANH